MTRRRLAAAFFVMNCVTAPPPCACVCEKDSDAIKKLARQWLGDGACLDIGDGGPCPEPPKCPEIDKVAVEFHGFVKGVEYGKAACRGAQP